MKTIYTVEPLFNEEPKAWQNVFAITRFRCIVTTRFVEYPLIPSSFNSFQPVSFGPMESTFHMRDITHQILRRHAQDSRTSRTRFTDIIFHLKKKTGVRNSVLTLSISKAIPSFSSKRGHVTEKHVLTGRKHDMLGNQTFEVRRPLSKLSHQSWKAFDVFDKQILSKLQTRYSSVQGFQK